MTPYPSTRQRVFWLSVTLSAATLALIFIGGLVTSTHSGLTVPDWPLSYGRLMPPMIGGIFFEHGHRMVATGIGFITVLLVLAAWRWDGRRWYFWATVGALGLVILQGVFGGLTVLYKLPKPVSITHACLAQTFFCLTVALAVWSSRTWHNAAPLADESGEEIPLPHLALLLFLGLFIQLVLGALLRHTGHGAWLHVFNPAFILLALGWVFHRLTRHHIGHGRLWSWAIALLIVFFVQVALGIVSFLILINPAWIQSPVKPIALITAHVMVGALLLGLSFAFLLFAWKGRDVSGRRLKDYWTLTKPNISAMATLTALVGYWMGAGSTAGLTHVLLGTLLLSGGACTLNMWAERETDRRMRRTQNRPLPAHRLGSGEARFLGAVLALGGILYLVFFVNFLTGLIGAATVAIYVSIYTPMKKVSVLNTFFGAVAGALPPVMGWTAATNDWPIFPAWVLFAILFFWQYPHFFALAWMYRDDYARAGVTVTPVVETDGHRTAQQIVSTSFALLSVSLLPSWLGMAGGAYLMTATIAGILFLVAGGLFFMEHSVQRARRLFLASVVYLPVLLAALVADRTPPPLPGPPTVPASR